MEKSPEVRLPAGFRYAAVYAGIRKVKKADLALIVADQPASGAAVFTQNQFAAAPVQLGRKHLQQSKGKVSAVLINAGNANCATRTGMKVAQLTSQAVAKALRVPVNQVLPSSTGVIGVELNPDLITKALPELVADLSADHFEKTAAAIMTTDLVMKKATATISCKKGNIHIAGMTKGSGMIQPLMATTLGYVMTDAILTPAQCQRLLRAANSRSYNRMTVDGDTSTNDTVVLLASGASGIAPKGKDLEIFAEALTHVMTDLAKQIARDGEGATKLITVDVSGTKTEAEADRIARQIANSPLVKTAIAGGDPNWGRIVMAAGNAGVTFDPTKVSVAFQGVAVCKKGLAAEYDEPELMRLLREPDVTIGFHIAGPGKGAAKVYTCDFTEGYIKINGSYRT